MLPSSHTRKPIWPIVSSRSRAPPTPKTQSEESPVQPPIPQGGFNGLGSMGWVAGRLGQAWMECFKNGLILGALASWANTRHCLMKHAAWATTWHQTFAENYVQIVGNMTHRMILCIKYMQSSSIDFVCRHINRFQHSRKPSGRSTH